MPEDWVPEFPSQRPPFEQGNQVGVRHGAYSSLVLQPRSAELAQQIRDWMGDTYEERFEGAIAGAAMAAARLERVDAAREAATDADVSARLDRDARSWSKIWLNYLSACGLTPASAARILERRTPGDELQAHLEATYREEEETT